HSYNGLRYTRRGVNSYTGVTRRRMNAFPLRVRLGYQPSPRAAQNNSSSEETRMTAHYSDSNVRPDADAELVAIADYVAETPIGSVEAYDTARYCLMDSLGCAMLALRYPACVKHLGPIVPGTVVPGGVRVPGTSFQLDPIKAAFDIGCTIRWLDFND